MVLELKLQVEAYGFVAEVRTRTLGPPSHPQRCHMFYMPVFVSPAFEGDAADFQKLSNFSGFLNSCVLPINWTFHL